ncbi:uncharacterized protein (TIGR02679 family) [Kineosporia succinea]|uniref:Uncharacterized protein (TIGR02679 family) n=1 Tax=Kineosporia succinea TaxID=84632 RepID=A0ABT9P8I9_9ACTN|nr:uncharacterized protein (TIGR02679 family) [Kineosporia succinea]
MADLLGLPRLPAVGATLSLARIADAVREIDGGEIAETLERVIGPIGDRRAERSLAQNERRALWTWLRESPQVQAEPALLEWVSYLRAGGLVGGSVTETRELIDRALNVLKALPAEGEPLPIFADRVLHDPHALDEGSRLATIVHRGLSFQYGQHLTPRELWALAGVEADELSSTVLVAGLVAQVDGTGSALKVLRAGAASGEASVLTLQQVRSIPEVRWSSGVVHVVENPSVMAAALRRFGSRCPALVCVSGWPSAAGMLLLRRLQQVGAELQYHGDFDGDGLRIAAHLVAKVGAVPWRMSVADYDQAVTQRTSGPAVGRVSEVPWHGRLTARMLETGIAVSEETVVDVLLDDLSVLLEGSTGNGSSQV